MDFSKKSGCLTLSKVVFQDLIGEFLFSCLNEIFKRFQTQFYVFIKLF